jgi:hypothetical protein
MPVGLHSGRTTLSRIFSVFTALLVCSTSLAAESSEDEWQFELTPYLWLPTISADLNYSPPPGGDGGPSIDAGPSDWLDLLNGAALINGSARKGRFSINGDLIFLGLESDNDQVVGVRESVRVPVDASLNLATETRFDGTVWTLAAGYTVSQSNSSVVEIIGGVRYLEVDIRASWNLSLDITSPGGEVILPAQGGIEDKAEFWDGILGVRGQASLGNGRWSALYYLDAGAGSSKLTWQLLGGVSYRYGWGDLMLIYRHLDYGEDSDKLLENLTLSGPAFGARFRF